MERYKRAFFLLVEGREQKKSIIHCVPIGFIGNLTVNNLVEFSK